RCAAQSPADEAGDASASLDAKPGRGDILSDLRRDDELHAGAGALTIELRTRRQDVALLAVERDTEAGARIQGVVARHCRVSTGRKSSVGGCRLVASAGGHGEDGREHCDGTRMKDAQVGGRSLEVV